MSIWLPIIASAIATVLAGAMGGYFQRERHKQNHFNGHVDRRISHLESQLREAERREYHCLEMLQGLMDNMAGRGKDRGR